jgi:hypothetical protein
MIKIVAQADTRHVVGSQQWSYALVCLSTQVSVCVAAVHPRFGALKSNGLKCRHWFMCFDTSLWSFEFGARHCSRTLRTARS